MGDYGIKGTKPGYDAETDILGEGTSFTSGRSMFKAQLGQTPEHVDFFEITFSAEPSEGTTNLLTVAHGYSFSPICWLMGTRDETNYYVAQPNWTLALKLPDMFPGTDPGYLQHITYTLDSTNFKINLFISTGSQSDPDYPPLDGETFGFKYYIFAEDEA